MSTKTFVGWMIIAVLIALCVGFSVGAAKGAAWAIDSTGAPIPPVPDGMASTVAQENVDLKALLEKTNVEWKKTIDALAACNAQYSQSTILLSSGGNSFALSVTPSTGHFGIAAEGDVNGIWVIPQRVRRVMTLNGNGRQFFYYTDLSTGKLDGPYVPLPATPKVWSESQ